MPADLLERVSGQLLNATQKQSVYEEFNWMVERGFILNLDWINRHAFYFCGDRFIGVYEDA